MYALQMVTNSDVLARIKKERKRHGIVQKVVASWLNIDRTSYTKKETNNAPLTIEEVLVLCDRLDINPVSLFRDDTSTSGYAGAVHDLLLLVPEKDQKTIAEMVEWAIQGVRQRMGNEQSNTKER
jgi:transcriptional regulator with XRE-family HTH domain